MAPLVGMARLTAVMVAALVMFWALGFQTSFLPASSSSDVDVLSSPTSQLDFMYSVLHPLLMVIGFILLTGEAILAHRTLGRWPRETRKSAHLALQGAAFGFGLFGIWAKFRANDGVVANFLSLHSWMGLLCLALFAAQINRACCLFFSRLLDMEEWVVGFLNFWHRSEARRVRVAVLPWHVFLGLYTYGLAVATAETGLLEKLTFLQTAGGEAMALSSTSAARRRSMESALVNALGMGLALLCGVVVLAAVSPKGHHDGERNNTTTANYKAVNGFCKYSRSRIVRFNNDEANHGGHHYHLSPVFPVGEEPDHYDEWKLHN